MQRGRSLKGWALQDIVLALPTTQLSHPPRCMGGLGSHYPPRLAAQPRAAHASCLVKVCFAGCDVTCHQVIWGQCHPGQISEGVVLWSFLFFPPNARNHKGFNSLRNCREMKILLKNNSCNMDRTCFYFCSYVFRAMLGCGYACGANSLFPTVTMWQKHSRDVKARRSHCSCMLAPMYVPRAKTSSCFSCPEPINEMIIGIAWTWPVEQFHPNFLGSVGLLIVQGGIQPCAKHWCRLLGWYSSSA